MSDLAKDVAKELERRRRNRRLVMLSAWAIAIVAAVLYLRCGQGWGTGGKGAGEGPGKPGAAIGSAVATTRCQIRVDAKGISVDGRGATREAAVEVCRARKGAEVVVTGDAREGDWAALRGALGAAHIDIVVHQPPAGSAAPTGSDTR